jgi:predicted nucleic acid-binding protein
MSVLVDTSVWVEYFRHGNDLELLDFLIDENLVVTNDLILAELIPFLKARNQNKIISLLHSVKKLRLNINWKQIIALQYACLKNGLNGVGIPDLIIAQNAKQNGCEIYSLDNHFQMIKDIIKINLIA